MMLPSKEFARDIHIANFVSIMTLTDLGTTPAGVNFLLDAGMTRSY
jgi:hypothetical protein